MPDVWEHIKENSSLAFGDFWEHLTHQVGGGGDLVLIDGLEVEIIDHCFIIEVDIK